MGVRWGCRKGNAFVGSPLRRARPRAKEVAYGMWLRAGGVHRLRASPSAL